MGRKKSLGATACDKESQLIEGRGNLAPWGGKEKAEGNKSFSRRENWAPCFSKSDGGQRRKVRGGSRKQGEHGIFYQAGGGGGGPGFIEVTYESKDGFRIDKMREKMSSIPMAKVDRRR